MEALEDFIAVGKDIIPNHLNYDPNPRFDDMEALEDFIAVGKDLNEQDGEGRTAAHYACAFGRVGILKRLLEVR